MADLYYNFRISLLYISVLIALFSFIPILSWKQDKHQEQNLSETPFAIAHLLDPNLDGFRYTSWNRRDWINWLQNREVRHAEKKAVRKSSLTEKGINSVLIATSSQFLNAFQGRRPFPREENTYWGERLFSSFVFLFSERGGHRVFRCPPMYVAVKFEDNTPVHLHRHSKERKDGHGNEHNYRVNPTKDCVELM